MNYADAIEPVTALKTRTSELIRRARESGQPVVITQNGKATAILQDVASFQRDREALMLLKLAAQGDRDYRRGDVVSDAEADVHFRDRIEKLRDRG